MGISSYILIGYLAGTALAGIHLGWHMAFRLDGFDWQYCKRNICERFVFWTLLWPLALLIQPQDLIDPTESFGGSSGVAARMREEERLWNNPPPCGALVLYRKGHGGFEETFGGYTFHSVDVEEALVDRLREHPNLAKEHEGAILNWLRQRDDSLTEPTLVPKAWECFEFTARDLLRNGRGEVRCLKCNKPIPISELVRKDDRKRVSSGWHFNRLVCQNDHPLFVFDGIHIMIRPQNDTDQNDSA